MASKSAISFLPLGANLFEFTVAGLPLVLSLPSASAYTRTSNPFFAGETIGRVGNRIKSGKLNLNGTTYQLPLNNGANSLHGGHKGWGKREWSGPHLENRRGHEAVRFELVSEDGDSGYPGTVRAKAWYIAREADGKTELEVEYEAAFENEEPEKGQHGEEVTETVINITNHTAFSIGPDAQKGESRTIDGTEVTLFTNLRQEVDDEAIPTGEIGKFPDVEIGKPIKLGKTDPVFDHCFVLDLDPTTVPLDTRGGEMRKLVSFWHPETKIRFEALSTEPAFQFYTGEFIDLECDGQSFQKRAGFCVEAQRYIDAAGKKEWEGMVKLKRGEVWGSRTIYRAWKDGN